MQPCVSLQGSGLEVSVSHRKGEEVDLDRVAEMEPQWKSLPDFKWSQHSPVSRMSLS